MIAPKNKHIYPNNFQKSGLKTSVDRNSTHIWKSPKNITYRPYPNKTHHRCYQQQLTHSINQCYSLIGSPYPSQGNSQHKTQNVAHFNHKHSNYTLVNTKSKVKREQTTSLDDHQLQVVLGASPFEVSYLKMQQIKEQFIINNIELTEEVTEIVDLIKGERIKMKIIYEELLQEIKSNYKGENKMVDAGVNTEEMIKKDTEDCASQSKQQQLNQINKKEQRYSRSMRFCNGFQNNPESTQTYKKIVSMLQSININPDQILPQGSTSEQKKKESEWKKSEYRQLTNKQILKFQQMFLRKLVTRINEKNRKSNV